MDDWYEKEALHFAVQKDDFDLVKKLIIDGKDINAFDIHLGFTPLMYAVKNGNIKMTEFLLTHGANPNLQDEETIGNSALHVAAEGGTYEMCKLLLDHGADPMAPGWMWISPFDRAAKRTSPEGKRIFELLKQTKEKERLKARRPPYDKWGSIPRKVTGK